MHNLATKGGFQNKDTSFIFIWIFLPALVGLRFQKDVSITTFTNCVFLSLKPKKEIRQYNGYPGSLI